MDLSPSDAQSEVALAYETDQVHPLTMQSGLAVLILVGPGPRELSRLRHVLLSILQNEPATGHVILVDDREGKDDWARILPALLRDKTVVLRNPRLGEGFGSLGGIAAGVLHGLAWIQKNTAARCVLKLDTDAMIVSPFSALLLDLFDRQPTVGLAGTVGRTCNRADPTFGYEALISSPLITMLEISDARVAEALCESMPGKLSAITENSRLWEHQFLRVRDHVTKARERGYTKLSYCQGGAYALSREMLSRFLHAGCFAGYDAWAHIPVGEDVIMGMLTWSVGMNLLDRSNNKQMFGLHWNGLPFPPAVMRERGFRVIHSLKAKSAEEEEDLFHFFLASAHGKTQNSA